MLFAKNSTSDKVFSGKQQNENLFSEFGLEGGVDCRKQRKREDGIQRLGQDL